MAFNPWKHPLCVANHTWAPKWFESPVFAEPSGKEKWIPWDQGRSLERGVGRKYCSFHLISGDRFHRLRVLSCCFLSRWEEGCGAGNGRGGGGAGAAGSGCGQRLQGCQGSLCAGSAGLAVRNGMFPLALQEQKQLWKSLKRRLLNEKKIIIWK